MRIPKLPKLKAMPRRKRGWGNIGVGNWAPSSKRDKGVEKGTAVVGVCAKCKTVRESKNLVLWLPPFHPAGSEVWVCKHGCEEG